MWSTSFTDSPTNTSSKTTISSDFETQLSTTGTIDFGGGASVTYEPNTNTFRPGRFENLANALENEFNLGFSTTDLSGAATYQQNQEPPSGNSKVSSQPPLAFSAPEYGLDSIEGSYVLQGLRPKQGTHTFSSRFQQLLNRKLQAEAAAKSQQRLFASQQTHNEAERACSVQFQSNQTIDTQLHSTTSGLFGSVSDHQTPQLASSLLGQMTQAMVNPNYPMHSSMRDVQNGGHQGDSRNGSDGSRYPIMPSSNSYASPSVVPPHLGPPAVQPSYQPAPIRSQHYQRLLAAKLANSGQSDADASSSVANDGAASFMQHWADHTLDPNYPTPQEMSFLPSSHSPLYQLFNSGYAQDQWQPAGSVSDASVRNAAGNGNLGEHAMVESHYGTQTTQVSNREMWPVNQLERVDTVLPTVPVPPYYPSTEANGKHNAWLNPYPQPVEDSDAVPNQSSRAPGQLTAQQTGNDQASSANPVLPTPPSNQARATSVQNTKGSGRESTSSPQRNDGDGSLNGGDGGDEDEPKKAMLACHFCRGRKLKCDGTRPTCAHCDKRGLACSYDAQIRRRGPGKRKREQMAMLAAAEGKMDEDGTPLLHKLLAPKPKGKRGRKPKNRNPDGEASNSVQKPIDQGAGPTGEDDSEEPPYARPPNPYLPSYFITEQNPEYPLLGPPQGSQQPPSAYLSHPPQPEDLHMDVKPEHHPAYQPPAPPPQQYHHSYHPGYHSSAPWPEDLDNANKRQRTEHYPIGGRW